MRNFGVGFVGVGVMVAAAVTGCSGERDSETAQAGEGLTTCVDVPAAADTTIAQLTMRQNYGSLDALSVGLTSESLLRFDLLALPPSASVSSATLKLFALIGLSPRPIEVHRATAAWDEATVTWASFAQQFDPTVAGSFAVTRERTQKSVDLTALAQSWVSGAVPNDGVLLRSVVLEESAFASRENASADERPMLTVCYTTPVDHCSPNPCDNGGTCQNSATGYTCTCPAGYTGTNCETLINNCASNPCQNGGTCTNGVDTYACTCAPGFTGTHCETNIDDCSPDPCQNGGICIDGIASYTCQCDPGYTGTNCEILIDNCASNPCQNGGTCTDGVDTYTCACATGFTSTNCETNIDDCVGAPCHNGGTCIDGINSYTCACAPGWGGATCDVNLDECAQSPCQNGGTCSDGYGTYTCTCAPGFTGTNCEIDINECVPNPCQNGGSCIDLENAYACECGSGYSGTNCETSEPLSGGVAITLPYVPANPTVPHPILSDVTTTLKGLAVNGATQYFWDFGDGTTSGQWQTVTDSFNVGVQHAYHGNVGQLYVAALSVRTSPTASTGQSAAYFLQIADPTATPDPRIAIGADAGLWYLHTQLVRTTAAAGAPGWGQPYAYVSGDKYATCATISAFANGGRSLFGSIYSDPYSDDLRGLVDYLDAVFLQPVQDDIGGLNNQTDVNGNGIALDFGGDVFLEPLCGEAFALSHPAAYPLATGAANVVGRRADDVAQDLADGVMRVQEVGTPGGNGSWYGDAGETALYQYALFSAAKLGAVATPASQSALATFWQSQRSTTGSMTCGGDDANLPTVWAPLGTTGGMLADVFFGGTPSDPVFRSAEGFLYNNWATDGSASCSFTAHFVDLALRASGSTPLANWACDGVSDGNSSFDWLAASPSSNPPGGLATQLFGFQQTSGAFLDPEPCFVPMSAPASTALDVLTLQGTQLLAPTATICNCGDLSFNANQSIPLDASCSNAGAAPIAAFEWDLTYQASNGFTTTLDAGGRPITGGTVSWPPGFSIYATYPIAVRVTDTGGRASIGTCNVAITPPPHCPIPNIGGGASHVYQGFINQPVNFDASQSFDADGDPLTYAWDFSNENLFRDSTLAQPTHTFTAPGTYVIGLQVTDHPNLNAVPYNAPTCTKTVYTTVIIP